MLVDDSVDTTDASVLAAVGNALDIASISARSDDSTTFAVRTVATGSDTPSESTLSVTPRTTPKIRIAKENNIATVRMEAGAGVERIKLKKQDATASEEVMLHSRARGSVRKAMSKTMVKDASGALMFNILTSGNAFDLGVSTKSQCIWYKTNAIDGHVATFACNWALPNTNQERYYFGTSRDLYMWIGQPFRKCRTNVHALFH